MSENCSDFGTETDQFLEHVPKTDPKSVHVLKTDPKSEHVPKTDPNSVHVPKTDQFLFRNRNKFGHGNGP